MAILAIGSPKGGVGKTTTATHIAAITTQVHGRRTLLVDTDPTRSTLDWVEEGQFSGLDFADGRDFNDLHGVREHEDRYDLIVIDFPQTSPPALHAMLGEPGAYIADALLVPSPPELMDLTPIIRMIETGLPIPYLLAITRAGTAGMKTSATGAPGRVLDLQKQLRDDYEFQVADTIIAERRTPYRSARERMTSVLNIGGPKTLAARAAESEYRNLTREAFALVGLATR
ncbi:ParA family protein [Pseudonocardia sp. ICBG601]|uniref:ParA family protein n=1 Tax=Pseudonocardia sp. ICBG601 TaxID=2846759 RepID=UPI001CF703B1|nr:ParA family protein [Pseudonocardia sp. ICBG601]